MITFPSCEEAIEAIGIRSERSQPRSEERGRRRSYTLLMQVCGYVGTAVSAGRVLGTRVCVSGALLALDLLGIGTSHIVVMAFLGVAGAVGVGGAGWALWQIRPKDPRFEVVAIELSGFKLRWVTEGMIPYAVLDVSMKISIKVTNPNVTPIKYTSTTMEMFYRGSKIGTAEVPPGSQDARSEKVIEIPAKLDGLKITEHVKELFQDVAKREMEMSAVVTIAGDAIVWKIRHHWEVKVNSDIKVDPVFLKVLDQENRVEMELAAVPEFESKEAEQGETHAQTADQGETRAQTAEQGEQLAQTAAQ